MSTRRETVDYLMEQLVPLTVRSKAMFGEYCVWLDDKPVLLVCDDTVLLKPTPATDGLGMKEVEAYPGSRLYRVVDSDVVDNPEQLQALVKATAAALPSKPTAKRKRR